MQQMDGVVVLAQESRFQLIDRAGVGHLFILAHGAAAEPDQLGALQRRQAPVRVRYKDGRNVIGLVAHQVFLLDAGEG